LPREVGFLYIGTSSGTNRLDLALWFLTKTWGHSGSFPDFIRCLFHFEGGTPLGLQLRLLSLQLYQLFIFVHFRLFSWRQRETFGSGTPLRRHYASHAISPIFQIEKRLLFFLMAFGVVLQLMFLETAALFLFLISGACPAAGGFRTSLHFH
jgi:hypothetical protein